MKLEPTPLYWAAAKFYQKARNVTDPVTGRKILPKIYNNGSSRCFDKDTYVSTPIGNVKISDLKIGDDVISFNHETNSKEVKKVTDLMITRNHNKKCYAIKLKNGSVIRCTSDHKFFFDGKYVEIRDILQK